MKDAEEEKKDRKKIPDRNMNHRLANIYIEKSTPNATLMEAYTKKLDEVYA